MSGPAENSQQQAELVNQFGNITGADSNRARFFLESAAWNVQLALESFYENNEQDFNRTPAVNQGNDEEVKIIGEKQPALIRKSPQLAKKMSPRAAKRVSGQPGDGTAGVGTSSSSAAAPKNAASQPNRRFATLNDFKAPNDNNASSDSDSGNESNEGGSKKDRRQAFYVGGSDESGQQVLGPSKKSEVAKLTDRLFKEVKAHGAVEASSDDNHRSPTKPQPFSGAGFRLGDSVSGSSSIPPADQSSPTGQPRVVRVPITLFSNGFVVDNGPLRQYHAPESREFLNSIMKNRVPLELVAKYRGAEVEVDLENKRNDEYVPPKVSAQPFQGRGYTLGSVLPTVDGAGQVGIKAGPSVSTTPKPASSAANSPPIVVDQSKPTTKIRIRLLCGESLVAQFNLSHHIGDIRRYVIDSDISGRSETTPFVFATSFPAQELNDESQTIEQAGLLNSSIVQKLKK